MNWIKKNIKSNNNYDVKYIKHNDDYEEHLRIIKESKNDMYLVVYTKLNIISLFNDDEYFYSEDYAAKLTYETKSLEYIMYKFNVYEYELIETVEDLY